MRELNFLEMGEAGEYDVRESQRAGEGAGKWVVEWQDLPHRWVR